MESKYIMFLKHHRNNLFFNRKTFIINVKEELCVKAEQCFCFYNSNLKFFFHLLKKIVIKRCFIEIYSYISVSKLKQKSFLYLIFK